MRHIGARYAPPAHQRLAVSRPVSGPPVAVIMVLAALVALGVPASAPNHSGAADPSAWAVVSGSLATF
jgi:hypothetical protein